MESVGDLLRRERESQEKTLEDVAKATKMSLQVLEAIEDDRFSVLPAPVYVKGHLRTYARFLELDEDEVVEKYMRFTQQQEPEELDEWDAVEIELHEQQREAWKKWIWIAVALVGAIVAVLLFTTFYGRAPAPGSAEGAGQAPIPARRVTEAEGIPDIEVHELELRLYAKERMMVKILADGETPWEVDLMAGEAQVFEALEQFRIDADSGEDLEVYLNGDFLGLAGPGPWPVEGLIVDEDGMSN